MSQYKVPQDVEAEDKLIGWLSFRQLIYAGIAAAAAAMTFFSFQAFPPLVIIPLPIAILFGILTLPLRKDQPLETYLLAVVRFYLKPKIRRWDPDGSETYVEITTPTQEERMLSKDYGPEAAQERLDYLARIMDSRGWAYKELGASPYGQNLASEVAAEATTAVDVLDEHASISQSFKNLISQKDQERHNVMEKIKRAQAQTSSLPPVKPASLGEPGVVPSDRDVVHPTFNPYPSSMHQKVVLPQGQKPKVVPKKPASTTMAPQVSPAIMSLATSSEHLTVSTLAKEAKKLEDKEVVIKLH